MTKKTFNALLEEAEQEINKITNQFERGLEKVSLQIKRNANKIIPNLSEQEFLNFELVWADILKNSGYYDLVNTYIKQLNKLNTPFNEVLNAININPKLNDTNIAKLNIIKELQLKDLNKLGIDAGSRIKLLLANEFITGTDNIIFYDKLKESLESIKLGGYAKTYINTSINDYRQAVFTLKEQQMKSKEPIVWVYEGNDIDNKMRPLCQCLLNKNAYYSKSDKDLIVNDDRRRYNCRHHLLPLTEEQAINLGYVKGVFDC